VQYQDETTPQRQISIHTVISSLQSLEDHHISTSPTDIIKFIAIKAWSGRHNNCRQKTQSIITWLQSIEDPHFTASTTDVTKLLRNPALSRGNNIRIADHKTLYHHFSSIAQSPADQLISQKYFKIPLYYIMRRRKQHHNYRSQHIISSTHSNLPMVSTSQHLQQIS
jgi:hypothetical protein